MGSLNRSWLYWIWFLVEYVLIFLAHSQYNRWRIHIACFAIFVWLFVVSAYPIYAHYVLKKHVMDLSQFDAFLMIKVVIFIQLFNFGMCIFFTIHDLISFQPQSLNPTDSRYSLITFLLFWSGIVLMITSSFILLRLIYLEWRLWMLCKDRIQSQDYTETADTINAADITCKN